MNDLASAHKTLKSASCGYATSENGLSVMRGLRYKRDTHNWNWQPPDKRNPANRQTVICRNINGRFVKLVDVISKSGV